LCIRIVNLYFDPANVDDLRYGIQPYSVRNYGSTESRSARQYATFYGLMHQGNLGTTMANMVHFRDSDKVAILTNLFHAVLALCRYRVHLRMLHRSIHSLTVEFDRFCTAWLQDEGALDELRENTEFCRYRVHLHMKLRSIHLLTVELDRFCTTWLQDKASLDEFCETTEFFVALVLHWVQLRLVIGFRNSRASSVRTCPSAPNFGEISEEQTSETVASNDSTVLGTSRAGP
jgi:hypothetical protein